MNDIDTLPATHWAHDPDFVELLPVLDANMTRDEAQEFMDVVDGECDALANFIKAPEQFPEQLAAADSAKLYQAKTFMTCAKAAAESSSAVIPRLLVPWFARALCDIGKETARRGVTLVMAESLPNDYAVGMILKLGFPPEARQMAFEEAARRQGGHS